jgi:serine/threonine protein kinase
MIGQTLSHYKILEKLGSGGMGDVYVAEDTKLHRNVALKILPPEMATEERRQRFEREAQAIAALNHPNIVTIHSVEETEGVHFITMELVKGKTLTELIPKRGLPLAKLLEIAIPLADAVSAAHEQGITHRDVKPDNLMVSDEGRLKILDFGLAKLKQEAAAEVPGSELPTEHRTEEGRILGTVAYMSPEQAEGKTVDHRSDIFSIGILLYEMATGERPFQGDTKASLMSSILKDTPTSVTELRSDLPRDLAKLIRRCLAKNPEDRLQAAKDLRNELKELKQDVESGEVYERAAPASRPVKWMVGIAVAVVASAALTYFLTRGGQDTAKNESVPIQGRLTQLTSQPGPEWFPSLSPDGDNIVYNNMETGNWDIYLKRVGGERVINLTEDSPADDIQPTFSPDGEFIAFRSERDGGGIFLMGATGESVRRLTDSGYNPAWSPDGQEIAYATEPIFLAYGRVMASQLWAVNVATAEKRLMTERDAVQPSYSPHGNRIAYWAAFETGQKDIYTLPAKGGETLPVTQDAHEDWNPVWSPDGKHIYFSSNRGGSMNLWRIRIDEETGEVLGQPESVTTGASASHRHPSFPKSGQRIAYVEQVQTMNL